MPQQLKYVAQLAMDNFYNEYKGETDFWDLEDFITQCGNQIAAIYTSFYQQAYGMLRQEKKEEVVSFDAGWLLQQVVAVKKDVNNKMYATLDCPVMTFPYDQNSIGVQNVFITDPYIENECERTGLSALWQLKYLPKTNRTFFYSDVASINCDIASQIGLVNKGSCNVKQVTVYYIPVMNNGEAIVPDGVISDAITKTVLTMKQMEAGVVVDTTNDGNSNKVLQTELDDNNLR